MTRAALRAQAQNAEETEFEHDQENEQGPMPLQSRLSTTLIHEDQAEIETAGTKLDVHMKDDSPVRLALRDITDENYPQAEIEAEADGLENQSTTPLRKSVAVLGEDQDESLSTRKSTRKARPKAKGRTKKKVAGPVAVEVQEQEENPSHAEPELGTATEDNEIFRRSDIVHDEPIEESQIQSADDNTVEIVEASETYQPLLAESPRSIAPSISRTPRFDSSIHVTDAASTTEDSFLNSTRKRSPIKSPLESTSPASDSFSNSLRAHTPIRRVSSAKFQESFEAMDSLEDTIEQLTASLPLLPAEEMHSPESPVRTARLSVKPQLVATPNSAVARTPKPSTRKTSSLLSTTEKDKENAPPLSRTPSNRTPLSKTKTPLKARTPASIPNALLQPETVSAGSVSSDAALQKSVNRRSSPSKPTTLASPKKAASAATPATSKRKSVVMSVPSPTRENAKTKTAGSVQRRLTQKQPLANTTNTKKELSPKKPLLPAEKRTHQTSMSFSSSPAKSLPNIHKRRITSGGVLSTSKPGFIPAKSSKPPTICTFALPGEIVAEKLKAQKEAREEKNKQPKPSVAEQKAAKIKADREAREERVKLNQLKAQEAKAEKIKISKAPLPQALTISKARAEAAERGRQASKEWAEKMQKKKLQGNSGKPAEITSSAQAVTAS